MPFLHPPHSLSAVPRSSTVALWLTVWAWLLPFPAQAQPPKIGVSPPMFQVEISDRPKTHSFRLFNYDDDPVSAELSVHNWELDEEGQTRILPPTEDSLDQWIVINPVRLVIPPKGSQVVRFSIRPRKQPAPGEHRAMIFVTSQPAEEKKLSLRFNLRLGMAVYATVGEVTRRGTLHGVEASADEVRFDVSGQGTAHARLEGQFAIWPAEQFPGDEATGPIESLGEEGIEISAPILRAGLLPNRPVLPEGRRFIRLPISEPLPPGEYVLDLHGSLGETQIDRSFAFSIAAPEAGAEPSP